MTLLGPAGLLDLAGRDLGVTGWQEITQEAVDTFAAITHDAQWIHTDPERAWGGPFGGTVVHGFLTLALSAAFIAEVLPVHDGALVVNYGVNRVRFPARVPVGSLVRARVRCAAAEAVTGAVTDGVQLTLDLRYEVAGADKPCCVAEIVFRYYPAPDGTPP